MRISNLKHNIPCPVHEGSDEEEEGEQEELEAGIYIIIYITTKNFPWKGRGINCIGENKWLQKEMKKIIIKGRDKMKCKSPHRKN